MINNIEVLYTTDPNVPTPDDEKDPSMDPSDLAPDADDPGDDLPEDLKGLEARAAPKPDNVDFPDKPEAHS